jgi:uncharacterized protein YbbK (DUF523 family)
MLRVLVSACLLGENVRYNGAAASVSSAILERWIDEGRVVRFCPEVAGGLGVPRPAAELAGGRAVTNAGADVTASFAAGARLALEAALAAGAAVAVLKDGSPSCGTTYVYDGTFSGTRAAGRGMTADLFARNGIRVFSERQIEDAAACLAALERAADLKAP